MESNLNIREAKHSDMEALIALRFAFLEEFRDIDHATKEKLRPELVGYFSRHLEAEDLVALIGFVGTEPAVTAFLTLGESPPNDQYPNGRLGYVFNVYTQPELRGRGYALRLMEALLAEARRRGASAVNLNASEAGRPLYEKLGFAVLSDTAMRMLIR